MDFARAAVEAEARERSEAKKRKRFAEGGGVGEGEGAAAPQPRPAGGPAPPPGEATAREAKARREARRRLDAGAEATEEVALARAEERGGEAAAAGAGQPRPGFTAFNMDEEKEEGEGFDEGGALHREGRSRPDAEEEWLAQAEVVGGEVARRHLAAAAAGAAAEAGERAAPPSEVQLAGLKRRLGGLLREGETVARALQRSGGGAQKRPLGKRQKAQLERQRKAAGGGGAAAARSGAADPETLAAITECASALLEGGEHDVYSQNCRQLLREADLILGPAGAPVPTSGADDMFADDADGTG